MNARTQIQQYFEKFVSLTEEEFQIFYAELQLVKFNKKDHLLLEGELCYHEYFILSGLLRHYYTDLHGNEKIVQFGVENWWVTNVDSFINASPSQTNIQALEPMLVLRISKSKLEKVFDSIPKIERTFRIIAEKRLIALQRNAYFFMKTNSRNRYLHLVNAIPQLVQRVPQYMVASYLDITPEYLSELRKSL